MEFGFGENRFSSNRVYVVDCGGEDAKFEGSRVHCGEISCGEQIDCVIEAASMVYNMRNEKLSKKDRDMIDDCEKVAMRRFGYSYEVGDLVWGKVRSHPWWPGQIYNEDFAVSCARNAKQEGRVLVAFFGDNSYGWFDPIELIPFDINYAEKSKQSNDRVFVNAVEEAENEACRRAALGLLCYCRNPSNFRATGVKGFVEVDVCGYQPGGLYSVKQIKSARDGFQSVEMLCLLKELASTPYSNMKRSIDCIQNVAVVLAYRKAVFQEVDGTYALAFGVQPICDADTDSSWALDLQEQLPSQASLDGLVTPEKSFFCFSNHKKPALFARDHVVQRRGPPTKSSAFEVNVKNPHNRSAQDLPSFLKPPKKRLKFLDYTSVGPNHISDSGKGVSTEELKKLNDLKALAAEKKAGDGKLVKSLGRNERTTNVTTLKKLTKYPSNKPDTPTRATKPTMVVMQFPRQSAMPSVSELKARFVRFGHLHSAPRVFWKSSTCQVVFKNETDAKAAYSYAVESKSLFGSVKVEYCLQALEVPATQFPKPSRELAGKALDEVSPFKPMNTGDSAKPRSAMALQHQLLHPGVQPKSCVKKQQSNELESTIVVHSKTLTNSNGGSSSCTAININAKNTPFLPVPPNQTSYMIDNNKIAHFAEVCNMQYLQLKAKNNSGCTNTNTNTESIDISTQMLSLLMRCSEIVAHLKFSLGYVPLSL